ncbi:MAG: ABC transporter permease [Faecousia sp.]
MADMEQVQAVQKTESYKRTWKDSNFVGIVRRFARNKVSVVGLVIIVILVFLSVAAPLIAPYDYQAIDPLNAKLMPSAEHLFGTDAQGRDIFSRILYGGRYSLTIGVAASVVGIAIGVVFGALAGFFGGWVETVILRICDIIQSIPNTLLCICVSQVLGSGFFATCIALSVYSIPGTVRLLRATMMSVREQEFVEAARAIDCSSARIMMKHILPNCLAPLIVSFSMSIGMKIMSSAGLSFLGLGIQEPMPEWGAMISAGRKYLRYAPHLVIFPGIFVALVVLSFNLVGDGLRDALDPKLRK